MLTELQGKAGRLCKEAFKTGCPLIVRPTSEDVVTGHLFGSLRCINPRWWLPDLLNQALGTDRFQRQVFRELQIHLWQKQHQVPRHLVPWSEGKTEVDVVITWENPETVVYIEMKYGSGLSSTTVNNNGRNGYPSDQLIRNARVGLWNCGWYDDKRLFDVPTRDFVLVLCSPVKGHRLVERYRDPERLRRAIPHSDRLRGLPEFPFIGELSYSDIMQMLRRQRRWFTRPERTIAETLDDYLAFKVSSLKDRRPPGQGNLPFSS